MRIAAVVLVVLTMLSPLAAAAAEPVEIGFIAPLSGIFAPAGKDMAEGIRMAFDQARYRGAGKKLELIEEDHEGNPATAQAKYRHRIHHPVILVEFDHQRGIALDNDQPSRDHIHTVVRTPNGNDSAADPARTVELFGKEVLPVVSRA